MNTLPKRINIFISLSSLSLAVLAVIFALSSVADSSVAYAQPPTDAPIGSIVAMSGPDNTLPTNSWQRARS